LLLLLNLCKLLSRLWLLASLRSFLDILMINCIRRKLRFRIFRKILLLLLLLLQLHLFLRLFSILLISLRHRNIYFESNLQIICHLRLNTSHDFISIESFIDQFVIGSGSIKETVIYVTIFSRIDSHKVASSQVLRLGLSNKFSISQRSSLS
jgi:hypothetical protein